MQEQILNHSSSFSFNLDTSQEVQQPTGFFELKPTAEKLENTARKNPHANEAAVMITNADVLIKAEEKSLAEHLLRQCLYLNPKHPEALKKLAEITNGTQLRLKAYETLIQTEYSFKNLSHLGNSYYQNGQQEKSKEIYEMALSAATEEHPELFEIYKNLGNIFMREADFDAAEEHYNKAFAVNPLSATLHVNLGTLAMQKADNPTALEKFRSALELDPKNDKAWVGLGMVHHDMGDFVLARANIENAMDINPLNRTAVQLAATWAAQNHDFGFAIEALQNYVSNFVGNVDFSQEDASFCDEEMSLLLIHLLCLRNQFFEAKLEIERLLLWNPKSQKLQKIEEEIRNASK